MIPALLQLAMVSPTGCACADVEPRLVEKVAFVTRTVELITGRVLYCHNGRRGDSSKYHNRGRAIDFTLAECKLNYSVCFDNLHRDLHVWAVAGWAAKLVGLRWGFGYRSDLYEYGHFHIPNADAPSVWVLPPADCTLANTRGNP